MKQLYILLCSIVMVMMLGCGNVPTKTPIREADSLHKHLGSSTVALITTSGKSGVVYSFCSGVWISETEIVTAYHCVAKEVDDEEMDPTGSKVEYIVESDSRGPGEDPAARRLAYVKAFDALHDLALLKAVKEGVPEHDVAALASELPGVGERIYVVGHPRSLYWTYVEGNLAAYRDGTSIDRVIQINGTVWFGNSGGGAFDRDGNLIGIASRLTRVPNMSFFVHIDYVKRLVKDNK